MEKREKDHCETPRSVSWADFNKAVDDYLANQKKGVTAGLNNSEYFGLIDHLRTKVVDGGCIQSTEFEKILEQHGFRPTRWGDPGFVEAMNRIKHVREILKDT